VPIAEGSKTASRAPQRPDFSAIAGCRRARSPGDDACRCSKIDLLIALTARHTGALLVAQDAHFLAIARHVPFTLVLLPL
jgi:predicted nucleic acid-binding protein